MLRIAAGRELEFLHPLEVGEMWGVGEATELTLHDLGVRTIGDLAATPFELLERRLGTASARHLSSLARGEDPRPVEGGTPTRSISSEGTFATDIDDRDLVEREVLRMCDHVAARLAKAHVTGHVVTLKIRFSDFTTITRSSRRAEPVSHTAEIWETAREMIGRAGIDGRAIRLLGVSVGDLVDADDLRQLAFGGERKTAVAEAVDEVRERFGSGAVIPARIAPQPERVRDRPSGER